MPPDEETVRRDCTADLLWLEARDPAGQFYVNYALDAMRQCRATPGTPLMKPLFIPFVVRCAVELAQPLPRF